jgi:hypothetical protein
LRPCRRQEACEVLPGLVWWGSWPWIMSWPSAWLLEPRCRSCGKSCGCSELTEIRLPRRPVVDVASVKVDGVELDPSAYRVDDQRWLVRLDGGVWPSCQDLSLEDTEAGTFSVEESYGHTVPESGKVAAELFACEVVKVLQPDTGTCAVDRLVQTLTRQGETIAFIDPMEFLDKGRTGLYLVDVFLRWANPQGRARRAKAFTAEMLESPSARRTGT